MLVIVGHGLSLVRAKLGDWLDAQTVVRLKNAPMGDPAIWGTRTDYICSRKDHWVIEHPPCLELWMFQQGKDHGNRRYCDHGRWVAWYAGFSKAKPSHGLCAAMCAVEFLDPPEIGVIGFDSMMHPDEKKQAKHDRPAGLWVHDQHA
jgi:hypothetical protein